VGGVKDSAIDLDRYTLVICEKPDAAKRIAEALKDDGLDQVKYGNITVYTLRNGGRGYVVCSASGHLYTVEDPSKKRGVYPVFDVEWFPIDISERSQTASKRIEVIRKLAEKADSFINACDFDLEGETIGYNILKYACGGVQDRALRAKFSTLTVEELRESFRGTRVGLGGGLAKAGRARHVVDFIYGVNLSRALSEALYSTGRRYRVVSIGRVQGPILSYVVDREVEIRTFIPTPFWSISAVLEKDGVRFKAGYEKRRVERLAEVEAVKRSCVGRRGVVVKVARSTYHQPPPTPFNIGDLQKEAYRVFGYTPSQTLSTAERLYLDALISYPRTSSQKLPPTIGYRRILSGLRRSETYGEMAGEVLAGRLTPNQGEKDDPAHPAIYPTGELPRRRLEPREAKLYDLVVRRFFAVFGEPALRERVSVDIDIGGYIFKLSGRITLKEGWLKYYGAYSMVEDVEVPRLVEGEELLVVSVDDVEKFEQHPPRYNQSSLLEKMEREGVGTKTTRAEIIKTLYDRGYITGESIVATDIAFTVVEAMQRHSPTIISTEMTRRIEMDLERIESGELSEDQVVQEAVDQVFEALRRIKGVEEEVGSEIRRAVADTVRSQNRIGPCPVCKKGYLSIIRSKKTGKRFVGCSGYRDGCRASAPLPQKGTLKKTSRLCQICGWPIIYVKTGRRPWRLCLNVKCESKKGGRRAVPALRERSGRQ